MHTARIRVTNYSANTAIAGVTGPNGVASPSTATFTLRCLSIHFDSEAERQAQSPYLTPNCLSNPRLDS